MIGHIRLKSLFLNLKNLYKIGSNLLWHLLFQLGKISSDNLRFDSP